MGNTQPGSFKTVRGAGQTAGASAPAATETPAAAEPQPDAATEPVNGNGHEPLTVVEEAAEGERIALAPGAAVTVSAIDSAIAKGMAAIVPLEWLERMLSGQQAQTIITRRQERRRKYNVTPAAVRAARQARVAKPAKAKVAKTTDETVKVDGRKGKIGGLYALTSKNRETVRGRDTIKRVHEYMKAHPKGVTAKQIMTDLNMPSSTVQYTLGKLQEKQAVNYKRPVL